MVVCPMPSPFLSIVPAALQISRVLPTVEDVTIEAGLARRPVSCPTCGLPSHRLHSHYRRVLRDLPWQGRPATIRVTARRFRCLNTACARKTFAERLGSVATASARRTVRLGNLQRHVAFALGGEAAARLAERLAIPTSPDTLLRMASWPAVAVEPTPTIKVLGVDDWAWRRGQRYGTMLVDLERGTVVDLLPDRQAETLATWLRQHPGIEIVARDRAGAYADGIRQGAPDAVQVSDRWHLLRNLGEAVRTLVDRHHGDLRRAARQRERSAPASRSQEAPPDAAISRMTAAQRRRHDAHARRDHRYQEAARLRAAGTAVSAIATALGAGRKTVRRWLRAGKAPLWRKPPQDGLLTQHEPYLARRWTEGCRNAALLWRELVALGFSGRPGIVRRWATGRRRLEPQTHGQPGRTADQLPATRQLVRLLMADEKALREVDRSLVAHLLGELPAVGRAITVARQLDALLRRKTSGNLTQILDAAVATPLRDFAAGLRRDLAAVQAALDLPWTTSPVEGHINRLKMLKRSMYGRAGFQLLRARVLQAA